VREAESLVERKRPLERSLEVTAHGGLIGQQEDRRQDLSSDPVALAAWLDAHELEVPMGCWRVQIGQAGKPLIDASHGAREEASYEQVIRHRPEPFG
jgi:hypothetical protein